MSDRIELAGLEWQTQDAEPPQDEGFAGWTGSRGWADGQGNSEGAVPDQGRLIGLYQEVLLRKLYVQSGVRARGRKVRKVQRKNL